MTASVLAAALSGALVVAVARALPGSVPAGTEAAPVGPLPVVPRRLPPPRAVAAGSIVGAVLLGALVGGPLLAATLAAGAVGARAAVRHRARRRDRRARDRALPDVVDLFVLAASVGHPVHRCVELVATRAPPEVRSPFVVALARVERGGALAPALHAAGAELGGLGATLTDALVAGLVTGSPLGDALATVAQVARDHRRRQAEEAARRLPVLLLLPLVGCTLPAFALLAVVPLLAGSLGSLT